MPRFHRRLKHEVVYRFIDRFTEDLAFRLYVAATDRGAEQTWNTNTLTCTAEDCSSRDTLFTYTVIPAPNLGATSIHGSRRSAVYRLAYRNLYGVLRKENSPVRTRRYTHKHPRLAIVRHPPASSSIPIMVMVFRGKVVWRAFIS